MLLQLIEINKYVWIVILMASCVSEQNTGSKNDFKSFAEREKARPELNKDSLKYEKYIEDAKFKLYLKMGPEPIIISNKGKIKLSDSIYYAMLDLKLVSCDEKSDGLWVQFNFLKDSSFVSTNPISLATQGYTSGVYYKNKNISDYYFIFGDVNMILFDSPLNKIDTNEVIKYFKTNNQVNNWFRIKLSETAFLKDSVN